MSASGVGDTVYISLFFNIHQHSHSRFENIQLFSSTRGHQPTGPAVIKMFQYGENRFHWLNRDSVSAGPATNSARAIADH